MKELLRILPAHTCIDRPTLPCDACGTTMTPHVIELARGESMYVIVEDLKYRDKATSYLAYKYTLMKFNIMQYMGTDRISAIEARRFTDYGEMTLAEGYRQYKAKFPEST